MFAVCFVLVCCVFCVVCLCVCLLCAFVCCCVFVCCVFVLLCVLCCLLCVLFVCCVCVLCVCCFYCFWPVSFFTLLLYTTPITIVTLYLVVTIRVTDRLVQYARHQTSHALTSLSKHREVIYGHVQACSSSILDLTSVFRLISLQLVILLIECEADECDRSRFVQIEDITQCNITQPRKIKHTSKRGLSSSAEASPDRRI